MNILHIIQGLPETAGTTVFVLELAEQQQRMGHSVEIICQDHHETNIDKLTSEYLLNVHFNYKEIRWIPDIVHVHAVWSNVQRKALCWCKKNGYKYVISIHGCLMPRVFAKSRLKKWLFYKFFLEKYLQYASALHCTSEYEADVCRKLGLKPPCIVAPIGIHPPDIVKDVNKYIYGKTKKILLFLGRISEEKGLVNLLDVWKEINKSDWKLIIAGPDWRGYKENLVNKISYENIDSVEFLGSVMGKDKIALYRSADLFVLPSPTENFSIVVLEALACGLPAIATRGTPWENLKKYNCGWWIDQGKEALSTALNVAMNLDDDSRHEMGEHGRKLALTQYTWEKVASKILSEYAKILNLHHL